MAKATKTGILHSADGAAFSIQYEETVEGSGIYQQVIGVQIDAGDATITAAPPTSSTANTPAIVTSAGTALAANASRKAWSIQNLDTDPLYVRLGGTASTSVFHFLLKGGSVADDGLGGLICDDKWLGLISVAGTTPRFVVSELT